LSPVFVELIDSGRIYVREHDDDVSGKTGQMTKMEKNWIFTFGDWSY
jgi:hypothetical protein